LPLTNHAASTRAESGESCGEPFADAEILADFAVAGQAASNVNLLKMM
jgi:hypothetical protein